MKANRARQLVMLALGSGLLALAGSCSAPQPVIPPPPAPRPAPPPPPSPRPAPLTNWRDAPITPGDWVWRMEGDRSVARFGGNALVLSCNPAARMVTLMRPGIADGHVPVTILTGTMTRTDSGTAVAGPPPVIAVTLAAQDRLLDAMAFSRGRFAVETAGLPTLYVPSWPEVSRVVEDCR